jgi:hypothetical protein
MGDVQKFECKSNLGVGLFTDEPQNVEISFPNGDFFRGRIRALTQEVIISLMQKGIKFDGYKNLADANLHMKKMINEIVVDGEIISERCGDQIINDESRARVMSHQGFMEKSIEVARHLAEEVVEESEENSES